MKTGRVFNFLSIGIVVLIGWIGLVSFHTKGIVHVTAYQGMSDHFNANSAEGWTAHSAYLKLMGDSVQFELIMFREVPQAVNWHSNSLVGTISEGYRPNEQRVFDYQELPRVWQITIESDGKCFFRLQEGPDPQGQPIVIPVLTKFKK